MHLRPALATAVALPLLAAAACSASPAAGSGTATSTASAAPDPNTGLLTGSQLKGLLAPASWFPAGFTPDPSGSVDTGSAYQAPSPAAAKPPCARLDATAWVALAGPGAVSFAQNDYVDKDTSEEYAQEIDVFQGNGAHATMTGLRRLVTVCPHFHDPQTSSTVTVTAGPAPKLGDEALTIRLQDPRWVGDTTLEAVRVGTAVATVYFSAASGTGQTRATRLAAALAHSLGHKA